MTRLQFIKPLKLISLTKVQFIKLIGIIFFYIYQIRSLFITLIFYPIFLLFIRFIDLIAEMFSKIQIPITCFHILSALKSHLQVKLRGGFILCSYYFIAIVQEYKTHKYNCINTNPYLNVYSSSQAYANKWVGSGIAVFNKQRKMNSGICSKVGKIEHFRYIQVT